MQLMDINDNSLEHIFDYLLADFEKYISNDFPTLTRTCTRFRSIARDMFGRAYNNTPWSMYNTRTYATECRIFGEYIEQANIFLSDKEMKNASYCMDILDNCPNLRVLEIRGFVRIGTLGRKINLPHLRELALLNDQVKTDRIILGALLPGAIALERLHLFPDTLRDKKCVHKLAQFKNVQFLHICVPPINWSHLRLLLRAFDRLQTLHLRLYTKCDEIFEHRAMLDKLPRVVVTISNSIVARLTSEQREQLAEFAEVVTEL